MADVVKCGHCDGKGVCERGAGGWSCDSCLSHSGQVFRRNLFGEKKNRAVSCSKCDGTGWVKIK